MGNALIALGGNVGDVRATFPKAISNILGMAQATLLARSSDYRTPPWGEEAQDPFINACVEIETSLDPHALLFTLHKIEKRFGRDRTCSALEQLVVGIFKGCAGAGDDVGIGNGIGKPIRA